MISISNVKLMEVILQLLKAYAWVLFTNKPWIGGIFLLATFYLPNIGAAGLIAALTATITIHALKFHYAESGIHVFNALLVGLSLGAFYVLDISLIMIILVSAILTVFVTVMFMNVFLQLGSLPVLTAPFVLVAITLAFATKSFGNLSVYLGNINFTHSVFPDPLADFFTALGSIFFLPQPVVGFILFSCILWQSRYLAFLCVVGFVVGFNFYEFLSANQHQQLAIYNGFNFSLTAMAIGAIYTVPSIASFGIAMLAAAVAAVITAASQSFMALYGLPVMALPFILTSLTILSALNARKAHADPILCLTKPDLPEKHFERARLAAVRLGDPQSVTLLPPFIGQWTVYQGFNGKHTHQAPWQYALDFIVTENGKSYQNEGKFLEDFFCYGLPVRSPTYGVVSHVFDQLADNSPGEVDIKNNWGNHILIYLESGLYVLLAHLQHGSVKVKAGENVVPGQTLASCGNTGRSPQPHLHLHVQVSPILGSETYPFHLSNISVSSDANKKEYKLVNTPHEGEFVASLENDALLATALHLPVGRIFTYEIKNNKSDKTSQQALHVKLNLLGEFRLQSDSGASAAFIENNGLLAFYDRTGPKDILLDSWLLAIGLTPYAGDISQWSDSPPASLLPLSSKEKVFYNLLAPLGKGLHSNYQRRFDGENHAWWQTANHELELAKNLMTAKTAVKISRKGCEEIQLNYANNIWTARLINIESTSDIGIAPQTGIQPNA